MSPIAKASLSMWRGMDFILRNFDAVSKTPAFEEIWAELHGPNVRFKHLRYTVRDTRDMWRGARRWAGPMWSWSLKSWRGDEKAESSDRILLLSSVALKETTDGKSTWF